MTFLVRKKGCFKKLFQNLTIFFIPEFEEKEKENYFVQNYLCY